MLTDPQAMQNMANRDFRDLADESFDTRTLLRNAVDQANARKYEDFLIVDTDSHHYETEAFKEIAEYIDDPVMRFEAKFQGHSRGGFTAETGSYQELAGRITRYPERKNEKVPPGRHRDLTLTERWMDAMGVDIACLFPTPMLDLSASPAHRGRGRAWPAPITAGSATRSSTHEPRIRSMLYLPFNDPEAALQDGRGIRRPQGRDRLHGHLDALPAGLRQRLHEDLRMRSRSAACRSPSTPAFTWGDQSLQPHQPLHRRARARLHLVQHAAHDQLGRATACPSASRS